MAVAYDAGTEISRSATNPVTQSHTPTGTPKAVIAFVTQYGSGPYAAISATYGGVAMAHVSSSPVGRSDGEDVYVACFFLGSSIPTGAQTFSVTNPDGTSMHGWIYTLTADTDTEVVDDDFISSTAAGTGDLTVTLTVSGRTCWSAVGFESGLQSAGNCTPLAGWTADVENDPGGEVSCMYHINATTSSDITAGANFAISDDLAMIALAVAEAAGGPAARKRLIGGFY